MSRFDQLRRFALGLPGASVERKWGNVDTFLVSRRMFMIFVLDARERPEDLWLPVERDRFLELTGMPGLRPAPYLARAHWVACRAPRDWPLAHWHVLLRAAHERVVRRLPHYRQRELGFEPATAPRGRRRASPNRRT